MRKIIAPVVFLCGLMLSAHNAVSQTVPTNSDDGSPYGGVQLPAGSVPVGPVASGPTPPNGTTAVCLTNGVPDPCVVTGQYDRYRTSTNVNESTLATFNNASSFGMANFYKLTSTPPGTPPNKFNYEPVVAQPLYVTNVPQPSGGTKNVLVVASLNDYVYAFDTGSGTGAGPALVHQRRIGLRRF